MTERPNSSRISTLMAFLIGFGVVGLLPGCGLFKEKIPPPNILVLLADDESWLHTGITGESGVNTPTFDSLAREGILFTHAFSAAPGCSPSRAALLTGQAIWRLGPAANQGGPLDAHFKVYPDILEDHGYRVGYVGKGWSPGEYKASGRTRNPAGEAIISGNRPPRIEYFRAFLDSLPEGVPFCFWFGSRRPHRPYGQIRFDGHTLANIKTFPIWPDVSEVRGDIRHYLKRIERFDRQAAMMLRVLEERGQLDNTLVVITSDNGMPFPRGKANLYDLGTRVPLAICWKDRIKGGRVSDDLVSLTDLAPTFLDVAGVKIPREMTGRSLVDILFPGKKRLGRPKRDAVFSARERHAFAREGGVGYPMRAIRTHDYLFIRNYAPDRWPAGDPPYFSDVDSWDYSYYSPTKEFMVVHRDSSGVRPLFELCFGKRPKEELYDLREDSLQVVNLLSVRSDSADESLTDYSLIARELASRLDKYLKKTGDARAGYGEPVWDALPYYGDIARNPRNELPMPLKTFLYYRDSGISEAVDYP